MFTDKVLLKLIAGKGGNGIVAWRRLKYLPKGGPYGGNGGRGGDIIIKADPQIFALDWFCNRRILKAESGVIGGINRRQGRQGKDMMLRVPCGTLIKDAATQEIICDLTEPDQTFLITKGGKGGLGNACFKTATNQAPNYCTFGKEGESKDIELELKLIADVGLVGFPNAGKSTMISAMTALKARVAAYPFTTLRPNLGYIETEDYERVFIADIPGIIKNACQNRGLGLEFLRHIERTRVLVYVLDASAIDGRDPYEDFEVLKQEIAAYNPEILNKPYFVVLNKIDTVESKEYIHSFKEQTTVDSKYIFEVSAKEGLGLNSFKQELVSLALA